MDNLTPWDFLVGIRWTTPQDDPDKLLISNIWFDELVVGDPGKIYVEVLPRNEGIYRIVVWDDDGITYPEWNWNSRQFYAYRPLKAGEAFEFVLTV